MTDTANLGLPCISAAQAQKHVTHNEALRVLDTLVQLAVLDRDLTAPPGSPSEGQRWIVNATSPSGAWSAHGNHVAAWQDSAWQFSVPRIGWLAYVVDEETLLAWNGSAWVDALPMLTPAAPLDALAFNGLQINGDHSVSQEKVDNAVTGIGSSGGSAAYITDQWTIRAKGSLRVSGQRITSISLAGIKCALRTTVTTTQSSLGSGDFLRIEQPIEGFRASRLGFGASGPQSVALGVYIRASVTGTFCVYLTNSARDQSIVKEVVYGSANAWQWVAFGNAAGATGSAFAGDGSGTWLTDSNVGLRVGIALAAGSSLQGTADAWTGSEIIGTSGNANLAATASATFDVTALMTFGGVELPPIESVPLLMLPFAETLRLCQRHYWKTFAHATAPAQNAGVANSIAWTAIGAGVVTERSASFFFPVLMRAAPTMTGFNPSAANANARDRSNSVDCSSTAFQDVSDANFWISATGNAATTLGALLALHATADARM